MLSLRTPGPLVPEEFSEAGGRSPHRVPATQRLREDGSSGVRAACLRVATQTYGGMIHEERQSTLTYLELEAPPEDWADISAEAIHSRPARNDRMPPSSARGRTFG